MPVKVESHKAPLPFVQSWKDLPFWKSDTWEDIQKYLRENPIYNPGPKNLFRALTETPLKDVKVVILGQDPYPDPSMADGLAFSSSQSKGDYPASLSNIFRELTADLGCNYPSNGDLTDWAQQGVLLLNSIFTCEPFKSMSHKDLGWQFLTHQILQAVVSVNPAAVFVLWGRAAEQSSEGVIKRWTIRTSHPSPQGSLNTSTTLRNFKGSKPFSTVNSILRETKKTEIDWRLS